MPRLRDPLKVRSVRLQVSCTPEEVRRVQRLAKTTGKGSLSEMAHQLLVAALDVAEREAA